MKSCVTDIAVPWAGEGERLHKWIDACIMALQRTQVGTHFSHFTRQALQNFCTHSTLQSPLRKLRNQTAKYKVCIFLHRMILLVFTAISFTTLSLLSSKKSCFHLAFTFLWERLVDCMFTSNFRELSYKVRLTEEMRRGESGCSVEGDMWKSWDTVWPLTRATETEWKQNDKMWEEKWFWVKTDYIFCFVLWCRYGHSVPSS